MIDSQKAPPNSRQNRTVKHLGRTTGGSGRPGCVKPAPLRVAPCLNHGEIGEKAPGGGRVIPAFGERRETWIIDDGRLAGSDLRVLELKSV